MQFALCLHRVGGCFFALKADEHNASPATCGKDWAGARIRLISLFVFCGLGDIHTCESIIMRPLFFNTPELTSFATLKYVLHCINLIGSQYIGE